MVLNNIKKLQKDHGFTIVELLVVIVVIGILASITIVSYTGITQRANTTKAQSDAASVQSVFEIYANENTYYPATITAANAGAAAAKLPAGLTIVAGLGGTGYPITGTDPLTSTTGKTKVTWECLTTCTNTTGGRITYFDFVDGTSKAAKTSVYVGSGTAAGTYVIPAAS